MEPPDNDFTKCIMVAETEVEIMLDFRLLLLTPNSPS